MMPTADTNSLKAEFFELTKQLMSAIQEQKEVGELDQIRQRIEDILIQLEFNARKISALF